MAASHPDFFRFAPLAALLLAGAALAAEPADIEVSGGGSFELDTAANRLVLRPIEIRQGAMSIRAEEGSINSLKEDYSDSEWHFRGTVHIAFEGGELDASEATVNFVANRLQSAHVTGTPATFSHQGEEGEATRRGRARTIDYDAPKNRLLLTGDVWFTDGRREFTTRAPLTYNLANRSVSSQGVSFRIPADALPKEAP